MKKINDITLKRVLLAAFGLLFTMGATPVAAQDVDDPEAAYVEGEGEEGDDEDDIIAYRRPIVSKGPTYEMKEVSGLVVDATSGEPLAGVRVEALNDMRYTAMTGEDGKYTISVPVFITALYISTPEYNGVQIPVREDESQTTRLYSSVFKSFYTNGTSIFTKSTASQENTSAISVETDIENHLNGVVRTVMRGGMPGQGAAMFINGITSLNTITMPLVVVDGVIWDMQYDRTTVHEGFWNNVLNTLDPEDIESVKVLNTGTALYGAKGANGVIEITTKRSRTRATSITARIYGGFEIAPQTIDVMNGTQYRSYMSEILGTYVPTNTSTTNSVLASIASEPFMNEDPSYTYYPVYHNNTDWQDGLYHTAFTQNYKINVQGGDEIAMYALSLGYTMSDATTENNDFDRLNIRFNTDITAADGLLVSIDFAYSRTTYNVLDNGWASDYSSSNISSPNVLGLLQSPMLSKYAYYIYWDEENQKNAVQQSNIYAGKTYSDDDNPFSFGEDYGTDGLANPYWILSNGEGNNKNYQEQTQFSLNINPHYEVNSWLTIGDRFSYILNSTTETSYLPYNGTPTKFVEGLGNVTSAVKTQTGDDNEISNDFYINFHRNMGGHTLNATGGFRFNSYSYSNSYLYGYNNTIDKNPNITYSLSPYLSYGGEDDTWRDFTYYIDAQYDYRNRYFVDATVSAQASSRFGENADGGIKLFGVRWGIFPAIRFGWVMTNESWFNVKPINYLKLAVGYEESGNDNIDYYATRTYFENQTFLDMATALGLSNISNSAIKWETTRRVNLGLEASLFDNRLGLGFNIYWSKTTDLLTKGALSYLTGLATMWVNDGAMTNKGLDFTANGIVINAPKFKWQLGFTIGHYKNEITDLPESSTITTYNLNESGESESVYQTIHGYTSSIYGEDNILTAVDYAAGVFYGYETAGVFSTDEEASTAGKYGYLRYPTGYSGDPYRNFKAGDVHFVDQNGDGWISEADMVVIGDPNPDLYGNIFTSLNFCKYFTLDVTFKYSIGNDIFNYQRSQLEAGNNLWNQSTAMVNRWTYSGQVTDQPRAVLTSSDEWVNNERFSDRWIEDGSFLKLKNIRLTYKLPLSLSWLQGLSVWGEANNVFTLTEYEGIDPEVSVSNSTLYQGIDAGLLSQSFSVNFGVTINL